MWMLIKDAEHTFLTGEEPFIVPTNPGAYPLNPSNDAIMLKHQDVEHNLEVNEFETYLGVANALRKKIQDSMNFKWLESTCQMSMGFLHLTPRQMINHLHVEGIVRLHGCIRTEC